MDHVPVNPQRLLNVAVAKVRGCGGHWQTGGGVPGALG
jgi:hypothetical protein